MVDIVFVHGLNGDSHSTWTAETSKIFWPMQLLPSIVEEEKVRILTYGYNADVSSFTDAQSKNSLSNHAEQFVVQLVANRRLRKANERPLIFVAHTLGGLLVKRALVYSAEISGMRSEHLRSIFVSTYVILFLGTQHTGSSIAEWGSHLERIRNAVFPDDSAPGFDLVAERIQRYTGDAPSTIAERWKMEKEDKLMKRKQGQAIALHDSLKDDTLPGFRRPNSVDISGISQNASHTGDITALPLHKRTYQPCIRCRKRETRCDLGLVDEPHDTPCASCRLASKECYFSATREERKAGSEG